MSLAILEKYDRRTANNILGAAALTTGHNVEGAEPKLVRAYDSEARELLSQIRTQLRIYDDESTEAQLSISNYITKAIQQNLFSDKDVNQALAAAGQAGRLNPAIYIVVQPRGFSDLFSLLSVKPSHVDDAVKHPDDYQHIMDAKANDESKGKISIFLKKVTAAKQGNDHWLLVQTLRDGLKQIAQSAWRVFPDVVELSKAEKPIDVLKAFVDAFGVEISLAGITGKFIESIPAKKGEHTTMAFSVTRPFFTSMSTTDTTDPNIVQVGAAYCIDTVKYGEFLERKKLISHETLMKIR